MANGMYRSKSDSAWSTGIERLSVFAYLPSVDDIPVGTRFALPSLAEHPSTTETCRNPSTWLDQRGSLSDRTPTVPTLKGTFTSGSGMKDTAKGKVGPGPYSQGLPPPQFGRSSPLSKICPGSKENPGLRAVQVKVSHHAVDKVNPGTLFKTRSTPVEGSAAMKFSMPLLPKTGSLVNSEMAMGAGGEGSFGRPKRQRANSLWGKLGASSRGKGNTEKMIIARFQDANEFSLMKGVAKRQSILCPSNTPLPTSTVPPARSVSWDVGMLVENVGLSSYFDPAQFSQRDHRVQTMLLDDAERVYTGSYGPLSKRKSREQQVLKSLIESNPAAFVEDAAAQAESEYRHAAEIAHSRLDNCAEEPANDKASEAFVDSVKSLRQERPFFNPPHPRQEVPRRLEVGQRKRERPKWNADASVFAQRKKENDSRALYDSERVLKKQFNLDWERIVSKSRFRRLVGREDAGVRKDGQALDEELLEIRDELFAKRDLLRMGFLYYSMMSGYAQSSSILQMSLNQWTIFTQECDIVDPKSTGSKAADLDTMFVSTNFEEESNTQESEANDDDALVRFEFLEIIVRASFGKYITSKILDDSSDSVQKFLDDKIVQNLPQEARINPNDFRTDRFYTPEMEAAVKMHFDFLTATFKLYKAKDKTKYFWIEHWVAMLESVELIGAHTGLEKREVKLIFAWSQMTVVDELKRRQRAVSLLFFDFVEALARVAELMSPPTEEDLDVFFEENGPPNSASRINDYYHRVGGQGPELRRASGVVCGVTPTRPLQVKFYSLMEVMIERMKNVWGGSTKEQLVDRMKKMASRLSGGIELG